MNWTPREVPVLDQGDEAKILTQEELGKGQEDHCWFNNGSPYTTSVFPKDTKREKKIGATEDQDFMIQRRYLKWWGIWRTQFLKSLLSILSIWIRNDEVMNEKDDEAEGSRRSLPTKQINMSIQLSFHDIVLIMHLFIFSWCIMHDRMFALMTVYY